MSVSQSRASGHSGASSHMFGVIPWIDMLMPLNRNSGGRIKNEPRTTTTPASEMAHPTAQRLPKRSLAVSKSMAMNSPTAHSRATGPPATHLAPRWKLAWSVAPSCSVPALPTASGNWLFLPSTPDGPSSVTLQGPASGHSGPASRSRRSARPAG